MPPNLKIETEGITYALSLLAAQGGTKITNFIIITDLLNLRHNWLAVKCMVQLQRVLGCTALAARESEKS